MRLSGFDQPGLTLSRPFIGDTASLAAAELRHLDANPLWTMVLVFVLGGKAPRQIKSLLWTDLDGMRV